MSAQLAYMPIASPRRISFNSSVIAVNTKACLVITKSLACFPRLFSDVVGRPAYYLELYCHGNIIRKPCNSSVYFFIFLLAVVVVE